MFFVFGAMLFSCVCSVCCLCLPASSSILHQQIDFSLCARIVNSLGVDTNKSIRVCHKRRPCTYRAFSLCVCSARCVCRQRKAWRCSWPHRDLTLLKWQSLASSISLRTSEWADVVHCSVHCFSASLYTPLAGMVCSKMVCFFLDFLIFFYVPSTVQGDLRINYTVTVFFSSGSNAIKSPKHK